MKYPHILENLKPSEPEEVLVFDKVINSRDGAGEKPYKQPEDWRNVRHIVGGLFFAWDNNPEYGSVYLGHYEKR